MRCIANSTDKQYRPNWPNLYGVFEPTNPGYCAGNMCVFPSKTGTAEESRSFRGSRVCHNTIVCHKVRFSCWGRRWEDIGIIIAIFYYYYYYFSLIFIFILLFTFMISCWCLPFLLLIEFCFKAYHIQRGTKEQRYVLPSLRTSKL